jgi:hypothetical protein
MDRPEFTALLGEALRNPAGLDMPVILSNAIVAKAIGELFGG